MTSSRRSRTGSQSLHVKDLWRAAFVGAVAIGVLLFAGGVNAFEGFDLVSGVIESSQFKGKDPLQQLRLASELLRTKRLRDSDMRFILLDWGDRYLREPSDPLERLKRWAELTNDGKLKNLPIQRDFLNRVLLAEYLVDKTPYLKASPHKKLELLGSLAKKNLVDWSVSLTYARIYAGGIITGAKSYQNMAPLEALIALKKLKDEDLVGEHYRIPTEGVLVAEALAMDKEYQQASHYDRLVKLRDLERKGIISSLTKKEFEKLSVWRILVDDQSFLKADASVKKDRILKLKADGLISASTSSDLRAIFRPMPLASPREARPAPLPQKITPTTKQ
ncbi:MAG: hypothetical protein HY913_22560 [Desulfomonile tiedjei]|nr:hypothetical protein [Desulfomonile tiedjei]